MLNIGITGLNRGEDSKIENIIIIITKWKIPSFRLNMSGLQLTFESIDLIPGHANWTGKIPSEKHLHPIMMHDCRNYKGKIKYWGRRMQSYANTTIWWTKKRKLHRKLRRRKENLRKSIKICESFKAQRKSKQQLATLIKRNHS